MSPFVPVTQVKTWKGKISASNAGYNLKEYCDVDEMLKIEKPDILVVIIVSRNVILLKEGSFCWDSCICDKPIATNIADLNDLYRTATKTNSNIWAMHTTRYDPHFYSIRQLIQDGAIGKVRMVNCQSHIALV